MARETQIWECDGMGDGVKCGLDPCKIICDLGMDFNMDSRCIAISDKDIDGIFKAVKAKLNWRQLG